MRRLCVCPIYRNAQNLGGNPAVVSAGKSISYHEFHSFVCQAHQNLKSLGVGVGNHVAVVAQNSVDYVIILYALWRCGAVACLLNPRLPAEALVTQLRTVGCGVLLTDSDRVAPFTGTEVRTVELCQIRAMRTQVKILPKTDGNPFEYDLTQKATVMFTSGSSGTPKPAVHSWGNHYYSALGANEHIPFGKGDRWLLSLPLYHVGGLGIVFRSFLAGGAVVVPEGKEDLLKAVVEDRVTHISLVPTQLYRFLNDKKGIDALRSLKAILLGGSAIPESLTRKALDVGLPVYISYGLTEMTSQVATSDCLSPQSPFLGARILKYREVKITDKAEIIVKGETLFDGYWEEGGVHRPVDQDGWFTTGDLGCLNEEGLLTVFGRKDNMFISGGENIQPEEIERHLCQIEGILHAVVVPVRDEEFGSRPVAFIEIKEGTRLSRAEILSFLRDYLPSFKLPDQIYAWPSSLRQYGIKHDRSYFYRLAESGSPLQTIS